MSDPLALPDLELDIDLPVPANLELAPSSQIYSRWAFAHYRSRRPCGLRLGAHSALWAATMLDLGPDAEVTIGEHCTLLDVIVSTNGRIRIGDCAMIGHRVVLADDATATPRDHRERLANRPEPRSAEGFLGANDIEVGANVWITAGSVILGGARIGEDAVVAAGAVVNGEVPAGATAYGNPYRIATRRPAGLSAPVRTG